MNRASRRRLCPREVSLKLKIRADPLHDLGPVHGGKELDNACTQLAGVLAKLPWLKPVAPEVFVGKYDPAQLRFPDSLLAVLPASPLHGVPAHDGRDWPAIRAWAGTLPGALQLEPPAAVVS